MILKVKYFCFFKPSNEDFNFCNIQDFGYGGRAVVGVTSLKPAGDHISREDPNEQVRKANSF